MRRVSDKILDDRRKMQRVAHFSRSLFNLRHFYGPGHTYVRREGFIPQSFLRFFFPMP